MELTDSDKYFVGLGRMIQLHGEKITDEVIVDLVRNQKLDLWKSQVEDKLVLLHTRNHRSL